MVRKYALRLEASDQRLELLPTGTGIVVVSIESGKEAAGKLLDLSCKFGTIDPRMAFHWSATARIR